jgi:outer membrane protein assembly factor BamB
VGKWVCLDWETGEVTYVHEWINKGSVIASDGMLYLYEQKKGNIALVRPNHNEFELVSTFKIFKGTGPHWAHLSIFDGIMYVRRGDVLMAYTIRNKH